MTPDRFNRLMRQIEEVAGEQEDRLALVYEKAIRDASRFYARQFENLTAAGEWVPPAGWPDFDTTRALTPARAVIEAAAHDIEQILSMIVPEIAISFDPKKFTVFSEDVLSGIWNRSYQNFGSEIANVLTGTVAESFEKGLSVPQTAKAIRAGLTDVSRSTATMLARTDLITVANSGSYLAAKKVFAGTATSKKWINTHDARTRPTHVAAGDQIVPMDQPFQVGGFPLAYPGDPSGPPAETINCRCTFVVVEGPAPSAPRADTLPEPERQPFVLNPTGEYEAEKAGQFAEKWGGEGAEKRGVSQVEYKRLLEREMGKVLADAQVRMRVPHQVATRILDDGRLKSQFETGTSGGMLNNRVRAEAERRMMGYEVGSDATKRPVYGYLSVTEGNAWLDMYGDVAFTFRREVRERTSFTAADSLGMEMVPSPVNYPDALSLPPRLRGMIARPDEDHLDNLKAADREEFVGKWEYWEAQIHDGVSVDDIEAVDIYPSVPIGRATELKARLEERGITVRIHDKGAPELLREGRAP